MRNTLKFVANLVIIGFVLGRAYNEWQHRPRTFVARRRPPRRIQARVG
ncbi:MAG TPA: hypothetical protein VHV81_11485 [Steroidobacteraceae bacterium]|jgi:hypothetical protein|nr:hypothetical protein [Steroidobacteraceae bacterium]